MGEVAFWVAAVIQSQFDPIVLDDHIRDIGPVDRGRLNRIGRNHFQQYVGGLFIEIIQCTSQAGIQECEINSYIYLGGYLPLYIRVCQSGKSDPVWITS